MCKYQINRFKHQIQIWKSNLQFTYWYKLWNSKNNWNMIACSESIWTKAKLWIGRWNKMSLLSAYGVSMIGVTTPKCLLHASNDANPTPPNNADIRTRACTPANRPPNPSFATILFMAWKTGVPGGTTPVANRVLTTSRGVVRMDENALAIPPANAYYRERNKEGYVVMLIGYMYDSNASQTV